MNRIMLAGIKSGSGKTLLTCGLIRCLLNRGLAVQAYKCGPDYIDPMFHKQVNGICSENLDSFFSDEKHLKHLLALHADKDIAVIEGVMGLFDGISPLSDNYSSYEIAKITDTPIVLIMDAKGMGRTLIPVLKGILNEDRSSLIKGVILNNISYGYYKLVSPVIEKETGVKALGCLENQKGINIDSRHLGLILPNEIEDINGQLERLSDVMSSTVDIEKILEIAQQSGEIADDENHSCKTCLEIAAGSDEKPLIAVAKDEAFCFLYEDNLRVLRELGAELAFFSPLNDRQLPDGCSGIILPGGYPELKLEKLESNSEIRLGIRKAIEDGIPCLAECGGFMYLHRFIADEEGVLHEMVGAIDGKCFNTHRLCRFGYVEVDIEEAGKFDNSDGSEGKLENDKYTLKGHEFHYYDSDAELNGMKAVKPSNGQSWRFGYNGKGRVFGFPHLYYSSCKPFAEAFVGACREYSHKNVCSK